MGLKLQKTLGKGIVAENCYVKIITIDYIKGSDLDEELDGIRTIVAYYYDKATRDANGRDYLEAKEIVIPDKLKEKREDQYMHLKTLDEFTEAVDE